MRSTKSISIFILMALLAAWFPAYAASTNYKQNFESGKWEAGWATTAGKGTMSFGEGNAHSGNKYVKVGSEQLQRYTKAGSGLNVSVWLYDDTSAVNSVGLLRAIKGDIGISVGVYTNTNKTHYTYRIGGARDSWQSTGIPRSTGWHRITIDASSGKTANIYFDGEFIASNQEYTSYDAFELGNPWPVTGANAAGFDDFSVSSLPEGAEDSGEEVKVYTDISGDDADRVKVLNALGVMKLDDSKFYPQQRVTRDEFVSYIISMMGLGGQAPVNTAFIDVDETNEYSGYIKTAYDMGFISGSGDRVFEPKENITFSQAIKILVLAAGYKNHALYGGGYADGYLSTANNAKILKDINGWRGDQPVTRSAAATLLFNTLEARYIDSIDDDVVESFMDHYLGVEKLTGIVYAAGKRGIVSDRYTSEGMCSIGNEVYHNGAASDIRDFIGHSVTAYIRDNDFGEKELVAVLEKNTKVFRIEADDIIDAAFTSISYYKGSVEKKVNIPQGSLFMYNGRAAFEHTVEDMKPAEGHIDLIDYDNDGTYDIVSVVSYANIYVGSIRKADKIIYDRRDSSKQLDLSGNGAIKIYDGNAITQFGAISAGTVISYAKSKDGELIDVYVCRDTVVGSITAFNRQESEMQIDGVWYDYTSEMDNEIFTIGDTGTFVLDICGNIAAMDIGVNDKYSYGYAVKSWVEDDQDTAMVRLFTQNGYIEKLGFAESFRYNGSKKQSTALVESGEFPNHELVRYQLDSDDKITELYSAKKDYQGRDTYKDDPDTFWLYEKKNIKYYQGVGFRSSGGTILPDAGTVYFNIPEKVLTGGADDDDYSVTVGNTFKDNVTYNYEAYNVNKTNAPTVMVLYTSDDNNASEQPKNGALKVFISMTQGINEKGDAVDYVNYYMGGAKQSSPVKDGVNLFTELPDKYSVIGLYNNPRGEITGSYTESIVSGLSGATLSNDGRMIWRVNVDEIVGDYMIVSDSRRNTYVLNLPTDRVYIVKGKNIDIGSKTDICVNDHVILRIYDGSVKEAVINNNIDDDM